MILTFLLAHANYSTIEEKLAFIFLRHPELEGKLKWKNFQELTTRHGWYQSAMKMKNDALKIAVENAKERKANLTTNAIDRELDMVQALEEERDEILASLKELPKISKAYGASLAALDRVTNMIARITDTDRIRKRDDLSDRAEAALYIAGKKGELKDPLNLKISENSEMMTEEDDAFTI